MKIALMSDLHYGFSGKTSNKLNRRLTKLRVEQPDVILLAGDLASVAQYQYKRCLETIRQFFPDTPLLVVRGNHDCVDKKTELLTQRGWVKYHDIQQNDKVLSICSENNTTWSEINNIIIKKSEYIYKFENNNLSFAVTDKHRIPHYLRKHDRSFSELKYDNILNFKGRSKFPCAKYNINSEYSIKDDILKLLAWILTDGSVFKSAINIYQSKLDGNV